MVARLEGTQAPRAWGRSSCPARRCRPEPGAVIDPTMPIATVTLAGVEVPDDRVLVEPGDPARPTAIERALEEATTALALSTVATCRAHLRDDARSTPRTASSSGGRSARSRPSSTGSADLLPRRRAGGVPRLLRGAHDRRGRRPPGRGRRRWPRRRPASASASLVRDGLQLHGGIGFTWEHDLHFLAEAGQGRRPALRHRRHPPGAPRASSLGLEARREAPLRRRGRGVPGRAARRGWPPTGRRAEEMAAEPVACPPAHAPGWARRWTRAHVRRRAGSCPAGRPSSAAATPVRSRRSCTSRSWPGRACPAPPTCRASASSPRRSSTTAPTTQIRDYAHADPARRGHRVPRHERARRRQRPGRRCRTRAVLDGDRFVVNGQKVWTSGANYADFCFLFCRTDPDAPEAQGHQRSCSCRWTRPGITVRPLPEIVRPEHPDLNEVFLSDVVGARRRTSSAS